MPSTELHFDNPRKQNHYERWLAERAVQKEDNCGCEWCLEFAADAKVVVNSDRILSLDESLIIDQAVSIISSAETLRFLEDNKPVSKISPPLGDAVKTFRKRGRPTKSVTPDQQAILERTDLSIRQKAEKTGLPVSTVGRLTKK